jgi:uncharacterized delta-60 repeat protein
MDATPLDRKFQAIEKERTKQTAPPYRVAELDTSFGNNGRLVLKLGDRPGGPAKSIVRCHSETSLFLASFQGYAVPDYPVSGIAKFDDKGELESSFGNGGSVEFRFGYPDGYCMIYGMYEAVNGDIFVWGVYAPTTPQPIYIVSKLRKDGTPDLDFGIDGHCHLNSLLGPEIPELFLLMPTSVVVNSDNTVTCAIRANASPQVGYIVRLTPEGVLDKSFQDRGKLKIVAAGQAGLSGVVATGSNDDILVFGQTHTTSRVASFITKLDHSGNTDLEFGENGVAYISSGVATNLSDVHVDPNTKKITAVGDVYDEKLSRYISMIMRFDIKGVPDRTFNQGKPAIYSFGSTMLDFWVATRSRINTATPSTDQILCIGRAEDQTPDGENWYMIGRFLASGKPDDSFGGDLHFCTVDENTSLSSVTSANSFVVTGDNQILCAARYNNQAAIIALKV